MASRYNIQATWERLQQTDIAIEEQRRRLETITDPTLKATAERTLRTLQETHAILARTHRLLVECHRGDACTAVL